MDPLTLGRKVIREANRREEGRLYVYINENKTKGEEKLHVGGEN
jgi:hypothetical protein